MTNKSVISKELSRLRKFGFLVYNFNFRKSLPGGIKFFVDHLIISKKYLIFVEVKIGKDTLSVEQKNLALIISTLSCSNKSVHYLVIRNIKECMRFIELILGGKL